VLELLLRESIDFEGPHQGQSAWLTHFWRAEATEKGKDYTYAMNQYLSKLQTGLNNLDTETAKNLSVKGIPTDIKTEAKETDLMSIHNAITLVGEEYNTPFDTITSDDKSYSIEIYKGQEHLATAHLSKVDQVINGVTTATIVQEIDLINIPLKISNIEEDVKEAADKGQGLIDYGTTTIRGLNAKGLDINAITLPLNFSKNETTDFFLSFKNTDEENGGLVPVEHPNGVHELSIIKIILH
jgi:hypothetical protein